MDNRHWNILCWNIRSINASDKWDAVRQKIDESACSMVCLQETKLSHISAQDVSSFLGQEFVNFVFLPAQQTRGGILVAWREGTFRVDHHRVHRHSVSSA